MCSISVNVAVHVYSFRSRNFTGEFILVYVLKTWKNFDSIKNLNKYLIEENVILKLNWVKNKSIREKKERKEKSGECFLCRYREKRDFICG